MEEEIKQRVYAIVVSSDQKMTPLDVGKKVVIEAGADRKVVKTAIRELVCEGKLRYSDSGITFLERSQDEPVRVSRRIVVKPPHRTYMPEREDIVIDIKPGIAFGNGWHPTTYLVLRALDSLLSGTDYHDGRSIRALDVGTGTGILAIAAAKLGAKEVMGIDIDRVALFEAKKNVRLNNLEGQITITGTPLEEIRSFFPLVVANIGGQIIEALSTLLVERVEEGGTIVLSGFMTDQSEPMLRAYVQKGLVLISRDEERNWACFVLSKRQKTGIGF